MTNSKIKFNGRESIQLGTKIITRDEFMSFFSSNEGKEKINDILSYVLKHSDHVGTKFEQIVDIYKFEHNKFEVLLETSDELKFFLASDKDVEKEKAKKLKDPEYKETFSHGILFSIIGNNKFDLNKKVTMNHLKNIQKLEEEKPEMKSRFEYGVNIDKNDIVNDEMLTFFKDNPELGKRLELEILETIPNSYLEKKETIDRLNEYNGLAARLKVDDYGAGENNMERINILIKNYPLFKSIKFDKEYVEYLSMDKENVYKIFKQELNSFDNILKTIGKGKLNVAEFVSTDGTKIDLLFQAMEKLNDFSFYKRRPEDTPTDKINKRQILMDNFTELMSHPDRIKNKTIQNIFHEFLPLKRQFVLEEMNEIELIAETENLNVVSEFVETPKILSKIIGYYPSIQYVQGYVFNNDGVECIRMVEGKDLNDSEVNKETIEKRFIKDKEVMENQRKLTIKELLDEINIQRQLERKNSFEVKKYRDKKGTVKEGKIISRGIHGQLDIKIKELYQKVLVEKLGVDKRRLNSSSYSNLLDKNEDVFVQYFQEHLFEEDFRKVVDKAIQFKNIEGNSQLKGNINKYIDMNKERINKIKIVELIKEGIINEFGEYAEDNTSTEKSKELNWDETFNKRCFASTIQLE